MWLAGWLIFVRAGGAGDGVWLSADTFFFVLLVILFSSKFFFFCFHDNMAKVLLLLQTTFRFLFSVLSFCVGLAGSRPNYDVAARIFEGSFHALSSTEGYVVVRRPE